MAKLYFYLTKTPSRKAQKKAKLESGEIVEYNLCTSRPVPPKTLEKYYEFLGKGVFYEDVVSSV